MMSGMNDNPKHEPTRHEKSKNGVLEPIAVNEAVDEEVD